MGVDAPLKPGAEQNVLLSHVTDELSDKGFVDRSDGQAGFVGAIRFAVADDLRAGLLCR